MRESAMCVVAVVRGLLVTAHRRVQAPNPRLLLQVCVHWVFQYYSILNLGMGFGRVIRILCPLGTLPRLVPLLDRPLPAPVRPWPHFWLVPGLQWITWTMRPSFDFCNHPIHGNVHTEVEYSQSCTCLLQMRRTFSPSMHQKKRPDRHVHAC
jgi:hypothetical protein